MERALQYMWEHRMYRGAQSLCTGKPVSIQNPGRLNHDAGPDFSGARIRIGDTLWVGNIEIHLRASDWYRHGHQNDPAYDNIILHVVGVDDARIDRADGSEIPQLTLPLTPEYAQMYAQLVSEGTVYIRCGNRLKDLPRLHITDCIEAMGMQRLQDKAHRILDTLQRHRGDWHQACFVTLARALGFGINAEPFEMLANRLPLSIVHHHSDNPHQIAALLYGMAGMLSTTTTNTYLRSLTTEFTFLARKYGLQPMSPHLWKRSRMRPAASPERRMFLLAQMLTGGFTLLRDLLDAKADIVRLISVFERFNRPDAQLLSQQSIELLLINVAAPIYYAYGISTGDAELEEQARQILCALKPERNGIISTWNSLGIKPRNAFESQALLQLRRNYCDTHHCLQCRWGHKLLRSAQL